MTKLSAIGSVSSVCIYHNWKPSWAALSKWMKLTLRTLLLLWLNKLALQELLLGFFPNLPSIKPKPASLFISLLNLTVDSKPMVVVFTVVLMPFGLLPIKKIFIFAGRFNLLQKLKACLVICVLLSAECIIIVHEYLFYGRSEEHTS